MSSCICRIGLEYLLVASATAIEVHERSAGVSVNLLSVLLDLYDLTFDVVMVLMYLASDVS